MAATTATTLTSYRRNKFTWSDTRRFFAATNGTIALGALLLGERTDLNMQRQRATTLLNRRPSSVTSSSSSSSSSSYTIDKDGRETTNLNKDEQGGGEAGISPPQEALHVTDENHITTQEELPSLFTIKHLEQRPKEFHQSMVMLIGEARRYQKQIQDDWIFWQQQCAHHDDEDKKKKQESCSVVATSSSSYNGNGSRDLVATQLGGEREENDGSLNATAAPRPQTATTPPGFSPVESSPGNMTHDDLVETNNTQGNKAEEQLAPPTLQQQQQRDAFQLQPEAPSQNVEPALELYNPTTPHDTTVALAIASDVQMLLFPPQGAGYPPQQADYVSNQVARLGIFQPSRFRRYKCLW